MSPISAGIVAKLDRAKEHFAALEREVNAFLALMPFVFDELRPDSQTLILMPRIRQAPPIRLSLIAGDILNNLRAPLDHLMCRLVEANNQKPTIRTAFPIYENPADATAKWAQNRLAGVLLAAVPEIHADQPALIAHPRTHALYMLQALNNHDKHREINIVGYNLSRYRFAVNKGVVETIKTPDTPVIVERQPVLIYRGRSDIQFETEVTVGIHEPDLGVTAQVLPAFRGMIDCVERTVQRFDHFLP